MSRPQAVAIPAALAAIKTGRPVRFVLSRNDDFRLNGGMLSSWIVVQLQCPATLAGSACSPGSHQDRTPRALRAEPQRRLQSQAGFLAALSSTRDTPLLCINVSRSGQFLLPSHSSPAPQEARHGLQVGRMSSACCARFQQGWPCAPSTASAGPQSTPCWPASASRLLALHLRRSGLRPMAPTIPEPGSDKGYISASDHCLSPSEAVP